MENLVLLLFATLNRLQLSAHDKAQKKRYLSEMEKLALELATEAGLELVIIPMSLDKINIDGNYILHLIEFERSLDMIFGSIVEGQGSLRASLNHFYNIIIDLKEIWK